MLLVFVRFLNLGFAGLLAGAGVVIWILGRPFEMPPHFYVEFQQTLIEALSFPLPLLSAATIISTLAAAFLGRRQQPAFLLTVIAFSCFVAGMTVTLAFNIPINRQVMTWSTDFPPESWASLRDQWWTWHIVRASSAVLGFMLLLLSVLLPARPSKP